MSVSRVGQHAHRATALHELWTGVERAGTEPTKRLRQRMRCQRFRTQGSNIGNAERATRYVRQRPAAFLREPLKEQIAWS